MLCEIYNKVVETDIDCARTILEDMTRTSTPVTEYNFKSLMKKSFFKKEMRMI